MATLTIRQTTPNHATELACLLELFDKPRPPDLHAPVAALNCEGAPLDR
jgi:hypothetical protein